MATVDGHRLAGVWIGRKRRKMPGRRSWEQLAMERYILLTLPIPETTKTVRRVTTISLVAGMVMLKRCPYVTYLDELP